MIVGIIPKKRRLGTPFAREKGVKSLSQIRQEHILQVLQRTGWDVKKASEVLQVSEKYLMREVRKIGHAKMSDQKSK